MDNAPTPAVPSKAKAPYWEIEWRGEMGISSTVAHESLAELKAEIEALTRAGHRVHLTRFANGFRTPCCTYEGR